MTGVQRLSRHRDCRTSPPHLLDTSCSLPPSLVLPRPLPPKPIPLSLVVNGRFFSTLLSDYSHAELAPLSSRPSRSSRPSKTAAEEAVWGRSRGGESGSGSGHVLNHTPAMPVSSSPLRTASPLRQRARTLRLDSRDASEAVAASPIFEKHGASTAVPSLPLNESTVRSVRRAGMLLLPWFLAFAYKLLSSLLACAVF